jgi:hypothetical protein
MSSAAEETRASARNMSKLNALHVLSENNINPTLRDGYVRRFE